MKNKTHKGLPVVLALSMLLASCVKHNELPGPEVAVRIHSLEVAEEGDEDVVRSVSKKGAETVSMPLGDGLLLEMSMERDASALRVVTPQPLAIGAKFRIIALKHNTTEYVSHGDFTDGETTSADLHVPDGARYDFICYSYNSGSLPTVSYTRGESLTAETLAVDATNDLLWQKIVDQPVSGADLALVIELKRVMVRVKVVMDCHYNGWTITGVGSGVKLGSLAVGGTINVVSGTVVNGGAADRTLVWSSIVSSSDRQTSDAILVMPREEGTVTVKVEANMVEIDGNDHHDAIPVANSSGTFTTDLKSGFSYKLFVRLRTPIWAWSNVYWKWVDDEDPEHEEGGNLTFDTTNEGHQGYQGVFFRWGSLVGVSPAKVINPNSNENAFEGESVPVYVPDTNEETGWRATTSTAEGCTTWSDTPPGVPYMNAGSYPTTASDRNNTYLIDAFQGDPATMYAHLRGDICQYLSKTGAVSGDYRLPTSSEFGTGWTLGGTSGQYSGTSKAEGTTIMIGLAAPNNRAYVENARMGGVTLPASGRRWSSTDGTLNIVGNAGYYWSGSASGGAAYYLNFTGTSVTPDGTHNRTYAMPIRCIKN